ncbi:hypothetical protein L596_012190 [Steinernema carpocapsae]|uniref:7TM GPCR serpentine receptor class x (Srx) domain-containing protein n=1 Tax=Steinernema carpocapsae TaxID=34508 RepID=A0A4V6A4Q2_STECR|nr:hypothetical protein L596_012190 [Steinernema carpocapsae]
MALLAILFSTVLILAIRKSRTYCKCYGNLLTIRATFESLAAVVVAGFFSTLILIQYDPPVALNATLSSIYIFALSNAYVLHLVVSLNRCTAIYAPFFTNRFFEVNARTGITLGVGVIISLAITALPYFGTCSILVFHKYKYDLMPWGCKEIKDHLLAKAVNIIWASFTFSALAIDLATLLKIILYSYEQRKACFTKSSSMLVQRNIRFFLQTFFQNVVICLGVALTHFLKDRFEVAEARFYCALFQILSGFVLNGSVDNNEHN